MWMNDIREVELVCCVNEGTREVEYDTMVVTGGDTIATYLLLK